MAISQSIKNRYGTIVLNQEAIKTVLKINRNLHTGKPQSQINTTEEKWK